MLPFLELLDTEEEKEKLLIIYECFKNALYETAYYKMKHVEQAEDMVHDTFMALTKHMDKIDEQAYVFLKGYLDAKKYSENLTITEYAALTDSKAHIRAWNYIVTILNHKIYDYWNKKETQSVIYVDEYDDMASFSTREPLSLVEEKEIKILLKEALLSMPDSYKEVIINLKQQDLIKLYGENPTLEEYKHARTKNVVDYLEKMKSKGYSISNLRFNHVYREEGYKNEGWTVQIAFIEHGPESFHQNVIGEFYCIGDKIIYINAMNEKQMSAFEYAMGFNHMWHLNPTPEYEEYLEMEKRN